MQFKGEVVVRKFSYLVWVVWVFAVAGFSMNLAGCDEGETTTHKPPVVSTEIGKAQLWLTTGDRTQLLARQTDISVKEPFSTTLPVITVDPAQTYQQMEGFGAALTGSSAYLINKKMSSSQRQTLLKDLFDATTGIGINAMRLTIGSSDFSLDDFTYDDMPAGETDFTLSNFSLAAEQADLLPVLKSINALAPDLTIISSPWSPPAWMKTNGDLKGGSLKTEAYEVYSNYFLKYIQAMDAQGITIDALTIQNEPLYEAPYPSMSMSSEEQKNFVKNNLGPLFATNSIDTKIILYDHNWDNTQYAISIMDDAAAKQYVAGSAFHAYGGSVSAMTTVHDAHPDKGLYFTEISGGEWATDFSANLQWNMANIFIGTTKNWSKTALLWNLALDENFGPTNNGCGDCRGVVTINSSSGAATKNVEYYSIGHFSKFVRNGAFRIKSTISSSIANIDFVAFNNVDDKRVIVLSNSGSTAETLVVKEGEKQFTVLLRPSSVSTIVWE
jgi:glucosylceramidase